jgi:putative transposase
MANTYTQIHIHIVFAVKWRLGLIQKEWKDELYRYITGVIQNQKHKLLAINGMPDHVHILIGMRPSQSLSELVQDIKGCSSKWINERGFVKGRFEWQEGFGAFSLGKSDVGNVTSYIQNQEKHHRKVSFREEFHEFLDEMSIEYDDRYVFKDVE